MAFQRLWFAIIFFANLVFAIPFVMADPEPVPNSQDPNKMAAPSATDEYAVPGTPVPQEPQSSPPDDTRLIVLPIPYLGVSAGYAGVFDGSGGYDNGGTVAGFLVMDHGRGIAIFAQAEAVAGGGKEGAFGYGEGFFKLRYRIPFDKDHILWGALGVDAAGRGAKNSKRKPYFRGELPSIMVGVMHPIINDKCVVQVFAKAAVEFYDSQTQGQEPLDRAGRPTVGTESLLQCKNIRFIGDYEHVFGFGGAGDTNRGTVAYSQVFSIPNSKLGPGFFLKLEFEGMGGIRPGAEEKEGIAGPSDPRLHPRMSGMASAGVELHFSGF